MESGGRGLDLHLREHWLAQGGIGKRFPIPSPPGFSCGPYRGFRRPPIVYLATFTVPLQESISSGGFYGGFPGYPQPRCSILQGNDGPSVRPTTKLSAQKPVISSEE